MEVIKKKLAIMIMVLSLCIIPVGSTGVYVNAGTVISDTNSKGLRGIKKGKVKKKNSNSRVSAKVRALRKQAMKDLRSHLKFSPYSRKELINEMTVYDGYSKSIVNYVVKKSRINWNKQALRKMKIYKGQGKYTKQEMRKQLRYDGYTVNQIKYAIKYF